MRINQKIKNIQFNYNCSYSEACSILSRRKKTKSKIVVNYPAPKAGQGEFKLFNQYEEKALTE